MLFLDQNAFHSIMKIIRTPNFVKKYSWIGDNKLVNWCHEQDKWLVHGIQQPIPNSLLHEFELSFLAFGIILCKCCMICFIHEFQLKLTKDQQFNRLISLIKKSCTRKNKWNWELFVGFVYVQICFFLHYEWLHSF